MVIGPADAPQFPDLQTPAMRRGAAHRPKSGNAATPHTALRGRHGAVHSYGRNSGARLIRALLIVCQILLGALPALLSVSPSAAQTVETVPSEPQNLSATPGDGAVALNWQAPASDGGAELTGYEYRFAEGAAVPATTVWNYAGTSLTVTVGSLTNGTAYAFEVRTANRVGVSDAAETRATPATVPGAPQDFTATPGHGEVMLTWARAGERRRGCGRPLRVPPCGRCLGAVRHGLGFRRGSVQRDRRQPDQRHGLCLRGAGRERRGRGRSRHSGGDASDGAVRATEPDGNAGRRPGNPQLQAPADDGGSVIHPYVYRYAEGTSVPIGTPWEFLDDGLTVTIENLTNGTAYAFEVRAVNRMGVGDVATATTIPATQATVPSEPQNLSATPGDGAVALNWQAPASDGGAELTGYEYRFAEGAAVPATTVWNYAGTSLTVTVGSLTNGTAYAFEVRTANRVGVSDAAETRATPAAAATAPSEPQDLSATPGDGAVALNWQAPASDGGAELTGYEYRFAEGAAVPATTVWDYAGTSLTVTVGSLTNGTAYAFEVRTANRVGVSDAAETRATPAAAATVPSEPQNLSATPGDGAVALNWQAPASDGGAELTGYEYRFAEGAAVPATTVWNYAGTSLTVTVGSLTNGTAYAFEVRTANRVGVSDAAETRATPATVPGAPQDFTATPGHGEVMLTWRAPASDGGAAVDRYEYRHAEGASVPAETAWASAGTSLTATIASLTNGTGYAFEARAVNDAGESDPASATAMPAAPATVPSAPQNLTGDARQRPSDPQLASTGERRRCRDPPLHLPLQRGRLGPERRVVGST